MRHAIIVVGCDEHREAPVPGIRLRDNETLREKTWYACANQADPSNLLDDTKSLLVRLIRAPLLAYHFYLLVHNTRLWSGKRPLVLVRGRVLSSRVAAYAGHWGGGDVVKADFRDEAPLGPTRYLLERDGTLRLRAD
jgi:hypothetical protein